MQKDREVLLEHARILINEVNDASCLQICLQSNY
jgi:hypothetical protein